MAHHLTEERLKQRTDALLKDLEAAKDPVAYRQRYHRPAPERSASSRTATMPQRHRSLSTALTCPALLPLLVTALAIVLGILTGSFLSLHLF